MKWVIIVDDSFDVTRVLKSALLTIDSSLEVTVAPSAEEALMEASWKEPDLVITDIRLPGISGLELVNKLRNRYPELHLILITGLTDPKLEVNLAGLGLEAFFRKPVDLPVFMNVVRRVLDQLPDRRPGGKSAGRKSSGKTGTLVKPEAEPVRLSDAMMRLHKDLDARSVVLLDDHGRVVAQAGELPSTDFESIWIPDILAAMSSGNHVNHLVGGYKPRSIHAWQGDAWRLLVLPVGNFALVTVFNTSEKIKLMGSMVDALLKSCREIETSLSAMGISIKVPGTGPLPVAVPPLTGKGTEVLPLEQFESGNELGVRDFTSLFERPGGVLRMKDVDSFWEKSLENGPAPSFTSPDVLNYEQAKKLGLAPQDEEK